MGVCRHTTIAMLSIMLCACAGLDYVKVPSPTQYDKWTDDDQKKADAMKGVRYYLPRPFLHLKQSTPVAQRTAFVSFRFDSAQGVYVLEGPESQPAWVKKIAPSRISITQALAATLAGKPESLPGRGAGGAQQSGSTPKEGDGNDTTDQGKPDKGAAPAIPSELHARTGFINSTDPITRLGDRMDVIYLPDFEEQYVIKQKTGLGKADIETQLRNGWAAEVFSQQVDNSKLIPYVVDQVGKASEALAGIVTTWAPLASGLPPGAKLPSLNKLQSASAGGASAEAKSAKDFLGEILIFKIAEVKVAQPGLYPILKPRELRYWLKTASSAVSADPETRLDLLLSQAAAPWIRPDMAFIPCPPFTMIGFNTTTDVFLAPATQRIEEAKTDIPQQEKRVSDKGEKVLGTLKLALDTLSDADLRAKLDGKKMTLSADNGKTRFVIPAKNDIPEADRAQAAATITTWVEGVWAVAKGKTTVAITTLTTGDLEATILIDLPPDQLLGN